MQLISYWRGIIRADDWRGAAGPLTVAWLLTLIGMPLAQLLWGDPALLAGVVLGVLLQASVSVLFLARAGGLMAAARVAATVFVIGWAAEALGTATGLPFGVYHYTDRLWPHVAGVPLLIPLAWLMMMPPAWAMAQRLIGQRSRPAFVLVSALAFTAWDLYLDPQMVAWGLWVWDTPGQYFGIPLINFGGWLLVSAAITALARPPALPQRPLILIYTLTWLTEAVGLTLFWGLYGPALCGFVGMGVFVWLAWRRG